MGGDGGNGGSVFITGGEGRGAAAEDYGGNVEPNGGKAEGGTGGSIFITSGASVMSSTGSVKIETVNAGNVGVSGTFWVSTGTSSMGNSGFIALSTGDATGGKGGDFSVYVGTGETGPGGEISVRAGKSIDPSANSVGGHIDIETGYSEFTSSGIFSLCTPNAGVEGVSGSVLLSTGTSSSGNSGLFSLNTGHAEMGHGRDMQPGRV